MQWSIEDLSYLQNKYSLHNLHNKPFLHILMRTARQSSSLLLPVAKPNQELEANVGAKPKQTREESVSTTTTPACSIQPSANDSGPAAVQLGTGAYSNWHRGLPIRSRSPPIRARHASRIRLPEPPRPTRRCYNRGPVAAPPQGIADLSPPRPALPPSPSATLR
jgi:hypothetical protein